MAGGNVSTEQFYFMHMNSEAMLQWKIKWWLTLCFFYAVKLLLSVVLIDVSVSNPLNCEMEEKGLL